MNGTDLPPSTPRAARPNWTRTERIHLLIWIGIGFVLPGVIQYLFASWFAESNASWTTAVAWRSRGMNAFFFVLATWVVSRLENRPLSEYGIPPKDALGVRFWEGAIWGFGMLSALVLLLWLTGHFEIESVALSRAEFSHSSFAWALVFLFVAITEEFAFRGYLLFVVSRRVRFWPGAIALSVGFAVAHIPNPGETVIGILQVLGTGLLFCFAVRRTGNLWFGLGYHAFWDWAQTFFYGTPDSGIVGSGHFLNTAPRGPTWLSGGAAGPEGSIFALLVLLLAALLIHLRFPNAVYPERPA